MKTTITPDSIFASLIPIVSSVANAEGLRGFTRFELEGPTLRGLDAEGRVVEDIFIGDDVMAPIHAQIALILDAKKIEDDADHLTTPTTP